MHGFLSFDGGKTYEQVGEPQTLTSRDWDYALDRAIEYEIAILRDNGARVSVRMKVKRLHIGALRPILGNRYPAFRRRHLSARKHAQGRWRAAGD